MWLLFACVYTHEHGLKKLKSSCAQIHWVAHLLIALSGDVEENPGPFTQISNDKNAPRAKQVNSVSLLESRLSEHGSIPVNVLGDGNCFSVQYHASYITPLSIICIYALLEFNIFCITLSCI